MSSPFQEQRHDFTCFELFKGEIFLYFLDMSLLICDFLDFNVKFLVFFSIDKEELVVPLEDNGLFRKVVHFSSDDFVVVLYGDLFAQ